MNTKKTRGHAFAGLLPIIAMASMFVGGLRRQFCTTNSEGTTGRHHTSTSKLPDGAFGSRHLLVKLGSDTDHVTTTGAADRPYGFTDDEPGAAGDPINVHFLESFPGTARLTVTGALAEDVDVFTAAGGQGQGVAGLAANSTYWLVGRTKRAAAQAGDSNYYAEIVTHRPMKIVTDSNINLTCIVI